MSRRARLQTVAGNVLATAVEVMRGENVDPAERRSFARIVAERHPSHDLRVEALRILADEEEGRS